MKNLQETQSEITARDIAEADSIELNRLAVKSIREMMDRNEHRETTEILLGNLILSSSEEELSSITDDLDLEARILNFECTGIGDFQYPRI